MVIVYMPGGVLWNVRTFRMDVPAPPELSETLVGLRLSFGLVDEETADRDTVPVKPPMLARSMVTFPSVPAARLRELTLVLRLKSWTLIVTVTEWESGPLVPVTVTV